MNPNTLALIIAIVAVLLGLLAAFLGWRRRRSGRSLLRGLSLALVSAGLWVTGVLSLIADAARGLWQWLRVQHLDTRMWIGIGIAAAGVIAFLISSAIDPVGRAEGRRRREARTGTPAGSVPPAGSSSSPQPVSGPPSAGRGGTTGNGAVLDTPDEDAEITAILKNHGIH